jgi:hypothetical protein
VYLKLRCLVPFIVSLALALANAAARAQAAGAAPASNPSTQATAGTLHGHITDPTGALIPGAQVNVTTAGGQSAGNATSDAAGAYQVRGLTAGSYVIQATFSGFAPFVSQPIPLAAGQAKNVDIKMAVEAADVQVVVTEEGDPTVSTDAGANASSLVIKGDDLDALSDDPDELSNELSALAGPSAGPNGGQIYIDGFTGGQLPPKSAIREIRINQNPFSAEFDRLGYGRIEILTKPGTDTLHGRAFAMGGDSALNTGNPFTKTIPPYHTFMVNGTISGPINKSASYFLSVEQRNNQDASIYTANTAALQAAGFYGPQTVSGGLFTPGTFTNVSPRLDLQLGVKNTLTVRYQFFRNNVSGQIGSTSLPTLNSTANTLEHTVQLDDTQVINDHIVNETRFEYRRQNTSNSAVSSAPTITVPGFFSAGGNGGQFASGHGDHYELQNFITMTKGRQAIKFGLWARDNRQATSTDSNFNASFSFNTVADYAGALNKFSFGTACPAGASQASGDCGTTNAPNKLTYTTGPYSFRGNLFDASLFIQDDWKFRQYLTLSGGLRWETQNHTADHNDWAPRVAFAYALDGHKKGKVSKTIVRGGYGFFYDRFQIANLMDLEQYSGKAAISQTQTVINNPTCFNPTSFSAINPATCGTPTSTASQIYTITHGYHAPYTEQLGISLERQVTKSATATVTYLRSFGVHQLVLRDSNAYLPGTYLFTSPTAAPTILSPRPDPNLGIVDQYFPEAVYKQNQLTVSINARITPKLSLTGFYNRTDAHSDGGAGSNPSNSYNLSQDYGRATFVHPQSVTLFANWAGPWGISFNPFVNAQSGGTWNFASTYDLTGDNFFNDRPSYGSSADCSATAGPGPSRYVETSFGCFDTVPQTGEALVPANFGTGPSAIAINMRASRSWGIGPRVETAANGGRPGGPGGRGPGGFGGGFGGGPGGGGGGGGRGGGGGGGGGGGFGGGGFGGGGPRGGMSNTGRKYSLTFSAQALNVFNDINLGNPSGSIAPQWNPSTGVTGPGNRFGTSTKMAGGLYASPTGSAARRVSVQMFFNF